jgi:hypothetical protein
MLGKKKTPGDSGRRGAQSKLNDSPEVLCFDFLVSDSIDRRIGSFVNLDEELLYETRYWVLVVQVRLDETWVDRQRSNPAGSDSFVKLLGEVDV